MFVLVAAILESAELAGKWGLVCCAFCHWPVSRQPGPPICAPRGCEMIHEIHVVLL